ncbi:alpha-amylase family glycosyl hydrolase [Leptotrichia buccalis]|uniref:Alpha amylase catalytic region n=1 Tax=Leptotrichia buccalis (strain ATCC 14201 / DSM 1135 / JCM 12969 / NCTC 10249 / C-1013-b) TaxID=523794 RepID=C7NAU6_LEPBD|nr:alpha-amylase family glycosyl hydrolase [Leptotrichia buccalis]ACV39277.1 alpha amylase catalytic region [Leptotrichia buccalis C-1013-b]
MSLFKLKLKVLLFLIGSIVSFSGQNEELQKNNDNPENYENYLISAKKENTLKNKTEEENSVSNEIEDAVKSNESIKYSQRNDGVIDLNSLVHKEDSEYRVADGNNVKIMLRTKNNDVYSAEVVYNGGKKMMRGIGNYGGNEIFMAEVPNSISSYYFVLTDDKTRYYMGRNISKDPKNVNKFEYSRPTKLTHIPEWAKGSVGYQIYIDSFRNGDVDNDAIFNEFGTDDFSEPSGEIRSGTSKRELVMAYWGGNEKPQFSLNEWNSNYEEKSEWEENTLNDMQNYTRYYGGDLEGVIEKLDYIKDLGVEYIILSSPFYSLSNHKYDTIYFNHVDPYFGSMEQTGTVKGLDIQAKVHNNNGDMELNLLIFNPETDKNLLDEDLRDTRTWVWTDSDLQLASLVKIAHQKGLKVVLEVAPDITSSRFFAINNKEFSNWYMKDTVLDLSNPEVRNYFENSMKKWVLGPDEKFKQEIYDDGIDGIRYVYYDNKNKEYIASITENLKKYKPDLLITGEVSNNITKDIEDGVYDSGADYNIVNNIIKYTVNTNPNYRIDGVEFATKLNEIYNRYSSARFNMTQVFIGSLDTDRIFSGMINPNRVYDRNNQSDQGYLNIRPDLYDGTAVNKVKRVVSMQMMLPATPIIYYGDEKGMWGADSPRNRKPMLWEDYEPYEPETDNISKYMNRLRSFPNSVEVNEVQKWILYPVNSNSDIENHYRALLKIRKEHKNLFKNGKLRILEVYSDPKTKGRVDSEITAYLADQNRRAKLYQGRDFTPARPNTDFISYEISAGNESMIIVVNNGADEYPLSLQVPKLFGFYRNQLNLKENYAISDKKIQINVKPYEVKVLYSNAKNMFDSFRQNKN